MDNSQQHLNNYIVELNLNENDKKLNNFLPNFLVSDFVFDKDKNEQDHSEIELNNSTNHLEKSDDKFSYDESNQNNSRLMDFQNNFTKPSAKFYSQEIQNQCQFGVIKPQRQNYSGLKNGNESQTGRTISGIINKLSFRKKGSALPINIYEWVVS